MWTDIWSLGAPLGEKILRPILVYAFLVVALRLAGKRELAQLTTLDFIVLLAVANAVQNGIIGNDNSVTGAWVGAAVLFVMNAVLALVLYRFAWLRRVVLGRATVLIEHGKLDERAVARERLSADELLSAVQSQGARTFAEVDSARLEPNGKLVVVVREERAEERDHRALTRELAELRRELAALTELVRQQAR